LGVGVDGGWVLEPGQHLNRCVPCVLGFKQELTASAGNDGGGGISQDAGKTRTPDSNAQSVFPVVAAE
jgi:hypothetical protein